MQKCAERLMSRWETTLLLDGLLSDLGRRRDRDLSLIHGLDQPVIVSATLSWICLKQKRVGQSPLSSHKAAVTRGRRHFRNVPTSGLSACRSRCIVFLP